MECEEGIYRVWRSKEQISLGSQSESDETPSRSSAEPSPEELELAKNDLLIPSVSRGSDLSPGVDEELHDTRENCFPRSP